MQEHQRPNPDELLQQVQSEASQAKRGRLKIFLGYAAGVGKTYAMLEAAHQRMAQGVDVVIGYIETHGRDETQEMIRGLEIVPQRVVEYHGAHLPEMDLDAVLARRPQLVLVDELAHANAPGSRHARRYLDVAEILTAGIDVYSTLNIQHVESLNDVVAQITGVTVREKVPDRLLDEADEIELVDLPPEELVTRLREGKVYVPDQAARAIEKFFRIGNLTALREVAMRRAAERVDGQMRAYMRTRAIPGPWPATERLMVCVSPNPGSERLIHATRRLANQLNAEWFALYVETPEHAHLSETDRTRLARYLQLAQDLGARVRTLPAASVAAAALRYALKHNVTKIIAGKPQRRRWREMVRGSVVDQIIRRSGDIDVYVITTPSSPAERRAEFPPQHPARLWWRYLVSLALVTVVTFIARPLIAILSPTNVAMLYLTAEVLAALYLGRGPAIVAALLGVLAFDFFYVPPALTFAIADGQYVLTFVGLFIVGLVISSLVSRIRNQATVAERGESHATQLAELSSDLAAAAGIDAIIECLLSHVSESFGRRAAVLLPREGQLQIHALSPDFSLPENELAVADWVCRRGLPAGRGTDTLPAAANRYLPMKTPRGVLAVLCVSPVTPVARMAPEQRRLLEAFASQAALAIERAQLAEHARQLQVLQATEQLQSALLNSVSHELRTPLVAITGTLSALEDDGDRIDATTRRNLAGNARQEAERLNRLVGNLLDMSRIEAGALRPQGEPVEAQELIIAALDPLQSRLQGRKVSVIAPSDLPLMCIDLPLAVQALTNVIENAVKYSPADSEIEITARPASAGRALEITVADRGRGIPPQDQERVFDKFYRVQRADGVGGTGMGLAISKGLVEAQGGRIWAASRPGGGASITMALPLADKGAQDE